MSASNDERIIAHTQLDRLLDAAHPTWRTALLILGLARESRYGQHLACHIMISPELKLDGDTVDVITDTVGSVLSCELADQQAKP